MIIKYFKYGPNLWSYIYFDNQSNMNSFIGIVFLMVINWIKLCI